MNHRTGAVLWIASISVATMSGCARHDRPAPATQPTAIVGARNVPSHAAIPSIDDILDHSMEVRLADLKQQVETGSEDEKFDAIRSLEEMVPFSQGAVDTLRFIANNKEGAVSYDAAFAIEKIESLRRKKYLEQNSVMKELSPEQLAAVQLLPTKPFDPNAIKDLKKFRQQLRSDDVDERVNAAEALGSMRIEAFDAIPDLMDALLDPSPKVRRAALDAFIAIRQIAIPESLKIASGDPAQVHEVCRDIRRSGIEDIDVAPALIFALGLDDPGARLEAAGTLRYLADPGIASVRGYFARLTDPTGRSYLPDAITDERPAYMKLVREKALEVIREFRPSNDAQLDMLLRIVADVSDPEAISAAVGAMTRDSTKGLAFLKARMKQQDVSEIAVFRGLGAMAHEVPEALDLLIDAADSEKPKVQGAVAAELGATRRAEDAKRAADVLATMATSAKDCDVRFQALRSLAQIGPAAEDAAPKLRPLVTGDDALLRKESTYTLSKIAPKSDDAVVAVLHLRGGADDTAGRERAIDVLLALNPTKPGDHLVPALANLLDDPDNALRLRVLERLASLGKEATPAAGRIARIVDNGSPEIRGAAVRALLAMDPDDRALSAALVAAVRRKDDAAVEKLAPRVNGSESCRGMAIAKLKQIAERESDQNLQDAAQRAILKLSPAGKQ